MPGSLLDAALGPAAVGELVKSLHCLIAASSLACVAAYTAPVLANARRHFRESRFLAWTWLISASQVPCFLPLLVAYVAYGAHPVPVPGLPDDWRVLYLAAEHTALVGRWAERRPSSFAGRFALACALSAVAVLLVFTFLPPPGRSP